MRAWATVAHGAIARYAMRCNRTALPAASYYPARRRRDFSADHCAAAAENVSDKLLEKFPVMTMASTSKGVLKAKLLEPLRGVEATGEELIITDRGVPVLKIVPIADTRATDALFADVRGTFRYTSSLDELTVDEWTDA
jgi:prevent-host-death family protein